VVDKNGYRLPSSRTVKATSKGLIKEDHTQLERSLFDFIPQEDFNEVEKSVALYLDEQEKLLWWYRNLSRQDYYLQGWKKGKIYPDFIFADSDSKRKNDYSKVFVIETKGLHLKNEDTDYKKNIFEFCNKLGERKEWKELFAEFEHNRFEFKVIFEDEWKARINQIFS
jgi:type III restriction enzyme